MSDPVGSPSVNPGRPKPRRWLRRLGIGIGSILILFIAAYFVLTSGAFFKGVILPKVGQAMHATITVSDASISPFSRVILKDLKVQTTGTEPLVTAQEVRAQYSLWAILGGNLKITEVALNSPTVTIVQNPDGSSNLDPLKGSPDNRSGQTKTKPASGSSSGGSNSGGSNSGGSKSGGGSSSGGSSGSAKPLQVDLSKVALNNATVRLITMPKEGGRQVVEVSKLNIALENVKNGQTGKLSVTADLAVDNQPAAPAARASVQGKFETSSELSLGNDLSLSLVKIRSRASVTQAAGSLSEINGAALSLDTELSADPAKQSAILRSLNLSASRRDTTLLQTRQSGPVTISWGGAAASASDATVSVILTNLNLAEWKGFTPNLDLAGQAHGTLELSSQESGKNVRVNLAMFLDGLGAKLGTNTLANLQLALSAAGQAIEFKKINVPQYRLALADPQGSLALVSGTLAADLPQNSADVEVQAEANLARLLALMPQNGLVLQSGQAQVTSKVSRRNQALNDTGTLHIQGLTGRFGERPFQDLSLDSSYDVSSPNPQQVDLRQLQLTLAPTDRARTNAATLSGHLNSADPKAIEGALKLAADTLDLTAYYDLFEPASPPPGRPQSKPAGKHAPAPRAPAPGPDQKSPPPSTEPESEPPAVQLPVKLVTADIQIDRCFLRELILSKVAAAARVESTRIVLNPISALINGAPMTAAVDLNTGVPGYQYDIALNGDRLPLEPIANSFSPAYRGQAKGDIHVAFNLKGEGVTGPSLQKNLGGALQLNFTNAEIQLVGPKAKALLAPIAVGLGYPEIFNSPLRWLGADAKVSQGKLQLSALSLVSPAFTAGTRGEIPFATQLAQSPIRDWPVDFAVPRAIAAKLKLAPKDTTNEFVALPNMVKAVGTLGNAETKVDAVALLQLGARTLTEIPGVGKDASKLLNQADSLLGGRLTGNTNASTNAGSTNSNPLPRKLGDLFKPKSK